MHNYNSAECRPRRYERLYHNPRHGHEVYELRQKVSFIIFIIFGLLMITWVKYFLKRIQNT